MPQSSLKGRSHISHGVEPQRQVEQTVLMLSAAEVPEPEGAKDDSKHGLSWRARADYGHRIDTNVQTKSEWRSFSEKFIHLFYSR
jgi:hypothetical protein